MGWSSVLKVWPKVTYSRVYENTGVYSLKVNLLFLYIENIPDGPALMESFSILFETDRDCRTLCTGEKIKSEHVETETAL